MAEKKALIVWGGWDGHEPDKVAARFARLLEREGFSVQVAETLDVLADRAYLHTLHLLVPIWTDGALAHELCENVSHAVAAGMGLAGNHGGMCDAFRANTQWQFITGGNWVSHPGGIIDYTVEINKASSSPLVEGLSDFPVTSEQYYLHYDPAVDVLATTRFPQVVYYNISNRPVDMPVVWTKRWGHGRVFYSALGHTDDVFDTAPAALELQRRGFLWAAAGRDLAIAENLDPSIFENDAKMY